MKQCHGGWCGVCVWGVMWLILHNDYKIGLILKRLLFNANSASLNELLFLCFVFLLGHEIWSILIIKQYLAECVFVLAINKYDNKTASRWQQIPVLINNLLTHSYQTIRLKRPIQSKRIKRTAESLTHLIRSKPDSSTE